MATVSQVQEVVYRSVFQDQASAGAAAAAKAIEGYNAALDATDQVVTRATRSAGSLIGQYDKVSAATRAVERTERDLAAALQALDAAIATGGARQQELARAVEGARAKVEAQRETLARLQSTQNEVAAAAARHAAATDALGRSSAATANQMRQLAPQINDVVTSLAGGASPFMVLTQQGGQITQIFGGVRGTLGAVAAALGPMGIAAGVAGAALVAVGISAQSSATHMSDLRQSLRLTSTDYAALAEQVDLSARRVAASTTLTRSGAEEIGKAIAGSRYLGSYASQLDELTKSAADWARVAGVDGAQAGTLFRQAIDSPYEAAKKLADQGLPAMNAELLRTVQRLDASGQSAQATALTLEALRKGTVGSTADVSSLTTAVSKLGQEFTSLTGMKESWSKFWTDFLAYPIEGLATLAGGLSKARDAILSVKDALTGNTTGATPGLLGATPTDAAMKAVPADLQPYMAAAANRFSLDPSLLAAIYSLEAVPDGRGGYRNSPVGAVGPMQVMPGTYTELAGRYGITGSNSDLGSNIMAAAAMLRELLDKFGDPKLAAIGYNGGPGRAAGFLAGQSLPAETEAYGRNFQSIYTGRGYAAGTGPGTATAPTVNLPVQDVVATRALPRSVQDLLGPNNDGTTLASAAAAADRIAKVNVALSDLRAQGVTSGESVDRLNAMLAKARGEFAGAIDPIQGVNRGLQDQLAPLQAATGAARTLAEAQNQVTLAARQAGREASPAEYAEAAAATSARLTATYRDNVSAIERQIAAQGQIAEAYRKSGGSVIEATARTQAEAAARETAIPGTAAYAEQVGVLTAKNVQLAASQNALGAIQQNRQIEDEIAYTQRQAATIGMTADARNRELAVLKVSQEEHRKYGDILPRESEERIRLTGVLADNTTALQHQQQVMGDLTGAVGGMVDQFGTSLADAFIKGEASGVSFTSMLQGMGTQLGTLLVKFGLVNEVLNAFDGGTRTTLGLGSLLGLSGGGNTAGGLLGALFGGSGSSSGGGWLASALGLAGSFFGNGSKPAALSGTDAFAIGGAAKDFASAGTQQVASTATGYSGLYGPMPAATTAGGWTEDAKQVATVAKGLDWLSGGKLLSGIKDAIGYQAGQSIGAYVSSVIGEATSAVGPGAAAAANLAGVTAAGGQVGAAASTTAASIVGSESIGTIGLATNTIAEALPYIGTAITVVTDLIQGNYRGAGLVAGGAVTGAVVGTYVFPGVGTAVGAALGAAIGGIADMLLPNHPKNPYLGVDIDVQDGKLVRGDVVAQLYKSRETTTAMEDYADAVNGYLGAVGVKIANPDGRIANLGKGIVGVDQLDKPQDVFKRLQFSNANPDDRSNFGIAKGALAGMQFDDLQGLNDFLLKVASLSDGMDALGIHLGAVNHNLTGISIASVDSPELSNLRTALAHDLPGKTFDTQEALQAELNKVNDWVNGTLPSLLNPVFQAAPSDLEKQVAALAQTYRDAEDQARAYGLATDGLTAAQGKAIDLLRAPAVAQLEATFTSTRTALLRLQSTGANDNLRADLMDFDAQRPQQIAAFKKAITDVYGPTIEASQGFADRVAEEEELLGAQRLGIVQKWAAQMKAAMDAVTSGTMSLWGRLAKAQGNGLESDLIAFDQSAIQQRLQRADQLKAAFGNGVLDTAGGQQEMEFLETVLRAEKGNIYKQYEQQAAQLAATADASTNALYSRGLRAKGGDDNVLRADLYDFDLKAQAERVQLRAQLVAAYGETITQTQGFADNMAALEGALADERLAITKRGNDAILASTKQAQDGVASNITSITGFLHQLQLGDGSTLSGADKLSLATRQFDAVSGAARAGDTSSLAQFQGYAQDYLTASRDYYATGQGYSEAMDRVLSVAADLSAISADTLTADAMSRIADDQTNRLVTALADLKAEVSALRADNKSLSLKLAALAA